MKVFVKTLKGTNFEIEVKPDETVADVKKFIETAQGADVYPAEQQMLIYQGKVLKDSRTLEEIKVAENSFFVVMLSKSKVSSGGASAASTATPSPAQPASSLPSRATQPSTTTEAPAPTAAPWFQALRTMVQANPQILQPMLQELRKQNPHLMRLIQEHQADFLRLINEPVEGEGNVLGQLASAMPQAVTVSPEEREAVERLEAMGFDRAIVLEVFFACNKNEELAANYLLDHMHEFEE